ncbi:MAG: hypothetical protein HC902_04900 [Calothrix sp. SM1_5_4]|nr:hypothetical protein [Calothrix sp. SM1_5_4]
MLASYLLWQESINLKNGDASAKMQAQSQGLLGSFSMSRRFSGTRWRQNYSFDLGIGVLKGKGNTDAINASSKVRSGIWPASRRPGL